MATAIVKKTDFETGKYKLAIGTYDSIQSYIDKYEPLYLQDLLGAELYKLFLVELAANNPPLTPIYKAIYDPILEDDRNAGASYSYEYYSYLYFNNLGVFTRSLGIKEMLMGFIYFEYQRDFIDKQTPSGGAKAKIENAELSNLNYIYSRYNEAIKSYLTIQWYIHKNMDASYPKFNGQPKQMSYGY